MANKFVEGMTLRVKTLTEEADVKVGQFVTVIEPEDADGILRVAFEFDGIDGKLDDITGLFIHEVEAYGAELAY